MLHINNSYRTEGSALRKQNAFSCSMRVDVIPVTQQW